MVIHPTKNQGLYHIEKKMKKDFEVTSNLCTPGIPKLTSGLLPVLTICSHLLYPYFRFTLA